MSLSSNEAVGPNSLMALLRDPEELKRDIKNFQEAKRQAEEAIALAGPANEILSLRGKADVELASQKEQTTSCTVECNHLKAEARRVSSEKLATAEMAAQQIINKAQQKLGDAEIHYQKTLVTCHQMEDKISQAEKKEKELEQREADVQLDVQKIQNQEAQLLKEKSQLVVVREMIDDLLR